MGLLKTVRLTALLPLVFLSLEASGENVGAGEVQYRRNSLYSIIINHPDQKFAEDIYNQFLHITVPDKFNDHSLSIYGISSNSGKCDETAISRFIEENRIASRLVGRWFNRDSGTGVCDMDLVKARGIYNASEFDKEFASHTARGMALLQDAGEELISNTFLLVNDVTYVDKNEGAQKAATALTILGAIAGTVLDVASAASGNSYGGGTALGTAVGAGVGAVVATYKGFSVKITTYLYQLVWDEETAGIFYSQHYTETADAEKRDNFEKDRDIFKLKFVGKVISKGNETSFLGINEDEPQIMVRKACNRAIDENIVDLQRAYEPFRVKSPVISVSSGTVTIPIGKKEGVSPSSRYEVLEAREKGGMIEYVRVGTLAPVNGKIWDNRFMAQEENAEGAFLGCTTFRRISGTGFIPGMLVREIM